MKKVTVSLLSILIFSMVFSIASADQELTQFLNHPSISPDGSVIAFEYEGDILTVPITGGTAKRLTIHLANETHPVISPDGKQIAFCADYYGSNDVFIMPIQGGKPVRLTHLSSADVPVAWSHDCKYIYFNSNRDTGETVYRIPVSGGTPAKMLEPDRDTCVGGYPSPDGSKMLVVYRSSYRAWNRQAKVSPGTADIYLCNNEILTNNVEKLTDNYFNDYLPTWEKGGKSFLFASNENKHWNLYRYDIATKKHTAITDFSDKGIKWFSTSENGKIVASYKERLYTIDANSGHAELIPVRVKTAAKVTQDEFVSENTRVTDFAISPDGKKAAFIHAGEVYIVSTNGGYTKQLTFTQEREIHLYWAPNSQEIMFNRVFNEGLNIVRKNVFDGSEVLVTSDGNNYCTPIFTPDGKRIVCHFNYESFISMNPDGSDRKVLVKGTLTRRLIIDERWFTISPSGDFISYIDNSDIMLQECKVFNLRTGKEPVKVSFVPGHSNIGSFTPDQRFFVFSWFEKNGSVIYSINLADYERTPGKNPKDALEEILNEPKEEKESEKKQEENKPKVKPKTPEPYTPIFEKVEEQTTRLLPSNFGSQTWPITLSDNHTVLFLNDKSGKTDLYSVDLKNPASRKKLSTVSGSKNKLTVDSKEENYYFICSGKLYRGSLKKPGNEVQLSPQKVSRKVDRPALKLALMEEYLWHLKWGFYDEKLHGVDLADIRARYTPLVSSTTTDDQFQHLMDEIIGEFDASHMGFYFRKQKRIGTVSESVLHLGFLYDDKLIEEGILKIRAIEEGTPASTKALGLEPGLYVTHINGVKVEKGMNVFALMKNCELSQADLMVAKSMNGEGARLVHLPNYSHGKLTRIYRDKWISNNRKYVKEKTKGRFEYCYISSMGNGNFDKLKNDLMGFGTSCDGVVMDFRYNGGGLIAHKVIELLQQKDWNFAKMRDGKLISEDVMRDFYYRGPVVGMFNYGSFSNAEMMCSAFRIAKLGPTVGTPTGGGVIGTWSRSLVDGSGFRLPQFLVEDVNQRNLERSPTEPEFIVPRDLEEQVNNRFPQLDRAIEELVKEVKSKKK